MFTKKSDELSGLWLSVAFVIIGIFLIMTMLCNCGDMSPLPDMFDMTSQTPDMSTVIGCVVCKQEDSMACGGVPTLCAKTNNEYCCAR